MDMQKIMNQLSKEDYNEYFPIFNKKGLIIEKKGNQYWLLHENKLPLTINQTALDILDLATGKNSIQTIIKKMIIKYNIDENIVTEDVLNVIYEFAVKDYILWKNKKNIFAILYMYQIEDTNIIYKVPDYFEIVKKCKEINNQVIVSEHIKKNIRYTSANIKALVDSRHEIFFEMIENEELQIFISLRPTVIKRPTFTCIFYYLEFFYINDNLKNQDARKKFDDFIKWCVQWELDYNCMFYGEKTFYITAITKKDKISYYREYGFEYIGKLTKECGTDTILVLQKEIDL